MAAFVLEPTLWIEEPGEIVPGGPGWKETAFDGWVLDTNDEGVAWAVVGESRLRLLVVEPKDRTMRLTVRAPAGGGECSLGVDLNGNELAALEVGEEEGVHELAVPSALWSPGANILTLTSERPGRLSDGTAAYFALRRLEYSADRLRITREPGVTIVPDRCGFGFSLEVPVDARILLDVESVGGGVLESELRLVRRVSGEILGSRSSRTDVGPGRSQLVLDVAATATGVELLQRWEARDGMALRLRGAGREEVQPIARPSVLFLSVDTLSAQHMSLYGYARATTPYLAGAADDFVVFDNARANAPWTIPSYMSQFTGLLPGSHMLAREESLEREPLTWELHQISPNRTTMAEFFAGLGYRTAAFVDNPWLARGFGFEQGFQSYDGAASEIPLEDPEGGLRYTVPRALAWLDSLPEDEPFFLFVQAFDPHAPYTTTAPWAGEFREDGPWREGRDVPVGRGVAFAYGCIPAHAAAPFVQGDLPATLSTAPLVAAYDEKILEVDFALGKLFGELEERGLFDDLLIVISADHGESTTGHDYFFGHALLYSDVLHVPLLMRLPGGKHSGRRIRDVVQLVDLFPTLIDIVRGSTSDEFHGVSFLPTLRDGSPSRGFAYAEWGMMEQAAVEAGGWKLIASQPRYSRYQTQVTSPRLDRAALGALVPELARGFPDDETVARLLQGHPEAKQLLESLIGPFYEIYDLGRDPYEADDLSGREAGRVEALLRYVAEGRRLSELARQQARTLPRMSPSEIDHSELDRLGYGGK